MINPLYWLELRVRTREKRLWMVVVFIILTLLVVVGMVFTTMHISSNNYTMPHEVGAGLIWSTLFIQAGIIIILSPLGAAGRISQEREQRTITALINSPLSRTKIVMGKLFGAWTLILWLGIIPFPFLFLGTLWGGPQPMVVIICTGSNLLAGLTIASLAIGLSGFFGRSLTAYLVTGIVLFGWCTVIPLFGGLALSLVNGSSSTWGVVVSYAAFFHHPLYPLFAFIEGYSPAIDAAQLYKLGYCYTVWLILTLCGIAISVKGMKREVY